MLTRIASSKLRTGSFDTIKIKHDHGWCADCQFGMNQVFMKPLDTYAHDGVTYQLIETYEPVGEWMVRKLAIAKASELITKG